MSLCLQIDDKILNLKDIKDVNNDLNMESLSDVLSC